MQYFHSANRIYSSFQLRLVLNVLISPGHCNYIYTLNFKINYLQRFLVIGIKVLKHTDCKIWKQAPHIMQCSTIYIKPHDTKFIG